MELYTYYRSSAAYRVRIALNLKGLPYQALPVGLIEGGGQQHSTEYQAVNPQRMVPVLIDGAHAISQSLAIIEYLDETQPGPRLLPIDPVERARARQFALMVACDIHPLNNLRVRLYLQNTLGVSEDARQAWYRHWILEGLDALELWLTAENCPGRYCVGDRPSIADCCLIPQLYNARIYHVDVEEFPILASIDAHCATLPAFRAAAPERQPDAPRPQQH